MSKARGARRGERPVVFYSAFGRDKNLLRISPQDFPISQQREWIRASRAHRWRRRLAGVVTLCSLLRKLPAGRQRHQEK